MEQKPGGNPGGPGALPERLSEPFSRASTPGQEPLNDQATQVYRPEGVDTFTDAHAANLGQATLLDAAPPGAKRLAGVVAEYADPASCLAAAAMVRDGGYAHWDVHTPYPVHGMDDAMGLKTTKIGWISMVCGLTGCLSAVLMIQWMNAIDYPLIIGGKPPGAVPSMIPIMFELSILLTGFGTVFGLLGLCRLPRHHHPVFESERFARFSDDRFFVSIEATDPRFDLGRTRSLLERSHALHIELLEETA